MSSNFWQEFFKFLKEVLPNLLIAFSAGKKIGEGEKEKVKSELREVQLEFEELKNHVKVEDANRDKSDLDIVLTVANGPRTNDSGDGSDTK
jgi:hypothetical protein